MHSAELRSTTIPVTRFRDGYDQQQVDAFLERCAQTLEAIEHGGDARLETRESIVGKTFSVTRFRSGYDQDAVDDLLDHVAWRIGEQQDG